MRILLRAGNRWYPYDITDDGYIGTWTIENPTAFQDKFPTKPSTLHSFLTFLENQNQVSISFANYKVERQNVTINGMESWKYNMTAEQDCVFSITQKFGKAKNSAKPTRDNIGALLDHAKIKASSVVKPIIKLLCPMHVGKKHAKERIHTQSQGRGRRCVRMGRNINCLSLATLAQVRREGAFGEARLVVLVRLKAHPCGQRQLAAIALMGRAPCAGVAGVACEMVRWDGPRTLPIFETI